MYEDAMICFLGSHLLALNFVIYCLLDVAGPLTTQREWQVHFFSSTHSKELFVFLVKRCHRAQYLEGFFILKADDPHMCC